MCLISDDTTIHPVLSSLYAACNVGVQQSSTSQRPKQCASKTQGAHGVHQVLHALRASSDCKDYAQSVLWFAKSIASNRCANYDKLESFVPRSSIEGLSFGSLDQHRERSSHILSFNPRSTTRSSCGRSGSAFCSCFLEYTWKVLWISEYGFSCVNN